MTDRLPDKEMLPDSINMLDRKQFNQFPDELKPTKNRTPTRTIEKLRNHKGI
jgi:hypothetical protein